MSQPPPDETPLRPGPADVAEGRLVEEMSTPRAAAVAGMVFAVILTVVEVLIHRALPQGSDLSEWITVPDRRRQVVLALELVPFAGIAFLWFIGVIRSRLGAREDKLFATAFLGSGLLFVSMLFSSAAGIGALVSIYDVQGSVTADEVRLVSTTSTVLLATFGIRMAAVFTLVVTNLGRRADIIPRWLQVIGYLTALLLLFAPPRTFWAVELFPAWVFLLSMEILVASIRGPRTGVGGASG